MPLEFLKQVNWIDIFVAIFLLRISYISIKNGLPLEFFKLLGTAVAVYLSLHYYTPLASSLKAHLPKNIPPEITAFFSFIILAVLGYLAVVLLRQLFFKFFKVEPLPKLNKWAGIIFGVARGFLLLSLVFCAFAISPLPYLKESVRESYSGSFISKIAPQTYGVLWNGLISKFVAGENFNNSVVDIQNTLSATK